jgi:hypothetical protein
VQLTSGHSCDAPARSANSLIALNSAFPSHPSWRSLLQLVTPGPRRLRDAKHPVVGVVREQAKLAARLLSWQRCTPVNANGKRPRPWRDKNERKQLWMIITIEMRRNGPAEESAYFLLGRLCQRQTLQRPPLGGLRLGGRDFASLGGRRFCPDPASAGTGAESGVHRARRASHLLDRS